MNLTRFVFKTHKWLAVVAGLFTFVWFVSGVVMVMPGRLLGGDAPEQLAAAGPSYREVTVSVPQAIAAAEAAVGAAMEVATVGFRRLLGRLFYQIETQRSGTHLVDAVSGERVEITAEVARQIVAEAYGEAAAAREATLLQERTTDYYGPLPAWRIALGDARDTMVYVAAATGQRVSSNRLGRWRAFIVGTHSFNFLQPILSDNGVRIALLLFGAIGVPMSLFGGWILWLQFQNWRAARRRAE